MQHSVHEAKTNLSRLLEAVQRGERVIITRHGKPAAELIPARPNGIQFGTLRNQLGHSVPDGFLEDLTEDELQDWEQK